MENIADDLAAILQTIRRPGDFHISGTFDLPPPEIEIEGFGVLALPVLPNEAERLVAVAERAPFGRGQETIVDPKVRRSWQISPERVHIGGKRWKAALDEVVARATSGLGVSDEVEAQFYKLLVYETGGFFVDHRDTEKSAGMFATLTIALPSRSKGGELVVRHAGREARIDMVSDDPAEARFAAFYADCVHEVRPVESGCRLRSIYNLIRKDAGKAPDPPQHDREEKKLADLLAAWARHAADPGASSPPKLVYPLSHAYTPAELAFASLKGVDAAAGVLTRAAPRAHSDVHLALLTIERTTAAEYMGRSGSGWGRWSEPGEDEYEEGEIYDHSQTLSDWKRPDGGACDFGEMPVAENELSPSDATEDMAPDEQHFHEAIGNEGASLERTYRRAALVIWPTAAFLAMLSSNGLAVSLPYLRNVVDHWRRGAPEAKPPLAEEARALGDAVPKTFGIDRCLVPAQRQLIQEPKNANSPAVAKLRSACIEHLRVRIAKPLAPPADFMTASSLTCSCTDCTEISKFLADPSLATWSLKTPQHARSHVETTILNSQCDVDTTTERRGSPHRLIVTKNQASYERLAAQRREDIEILAPIERVPR